MLGIRHYKGRAIDLWQGPSEDFCSDLMIRVEVGSPVSEKTDLNNHEGIQDFIDVQFRNWSELNPDTLRDWIDNAGQKNYRHVCFEWFVSADHCTSQAIRNVYEMIRDLIDLGRPESDSVRRMTSILKTGKDYELFRDEMLKTFPGPESTS